MELYRLTQSAFRSWRDREARSALNKHIFPQPEIRGSGPRAGVSSERCGLRRSQRVPKEKSTKRGAHQAVSPRECICRGRDRQD